MTQLFLLKLMAELLSDPTPEQIKCAKKILDGMIKELDVNSMESVDKRMLAGLEGKMQLDAEAQAAMRELQ